MPHNSHASKFSRSYLIIRIWAVRQERFTQIGETILGKGMPYAKPQMGDHQ
jgi:hypothetical protein